MKRYARAAGLDERRIHVHLLRYTKAPKPFQEPTQAEECTVWLVEMLEEAGEPLRPKEILKMAKDYGFSRGVVYRAREELSGVLVDTERFRHPDNRWTLVAGAEE